MKQMGWDKSVGVADIVAVDSAEIYVGVILKTKIRVQELGISGIHYSIPDVSILGMLGSVFGDFGSYPGGELRSRSCWGCLCYPS